MIGNNKESKIRHDIQALKKDLYNIKDDLEQISNTVVDEGRQTFNQVKEKAGSQLTDGLKTARKQMRHHPISTTLMAAGAGFLVGTIFSRHG